MLPNFMHGLPMYTPKPIIVGGTHKNANTSATMDYPEGMQIGDLIILLLQQASGIQTPNDFDLISSNTVNSQQHRLCKRVVDGSEGSSFNLGSTTSPRAALAVVRNVGPDVEIAVTGSTSGTVTVNNVHRAWLLAYARTSNSSAPDPRAGSGYELISRTTSSNGVATAGKVETLASESYQNNGANILYLIGVR